MANIINFEQQRLNKIAKDQELARTNDQQEMLKFIQHIRKCDDYNVGINKDVNDISEENAAQEMSDIEFSIKPQPSE